MMESSSSRGKDVLRSYFDTLSKAIQELNCARDAMLHAIFNSRTINSQALRENGTLLAEHLATCNEHLAGIRVEIRKHRAGHQSARRSGVRAANHGAQLRRAAR